MKSRIIIFGWMTLFACSSCSQDNTGSGLLLGAELSDKDMILVESLSLEDYVVKRIKLKSDTFCTCLVYGPDNYIIHYIKSNISKDRLSEYQRQFRNHFQKQATYQDTTGSTEYFQSIRYVWEDPLTGDYAILSSSKSLNDNDVVLDQSWDLEVGNDTIDSWLNDLD